MKKVYAIYFSPCGNTKNIVRKMAMQAANTLQIPVEEIDFTLPKARQNTYEIEGDSLVFFGTPVYAGRVPNKIMPFIRDSFRGNGALAVAVVSFGNRSFDNALIEQKLLLAHGGFRPIGAAAVVAQHSFTDQLATGRPDAQDEKDITHFTDRILQKAAEIERGEKQNKFPELEVPGENPPVTYYRPLGTDLKPANFLKAKPFTDKNLCIHCNKCIRACPMGSIDPGDPALVNGICIKCHACIHICPVQAKSIPDEALQSHIAMIATNYQRKAESVYIL